MLELTDANYYSEEANMEYMSYSQYKAFRRCEAAALAECRGEWKRKPTSALLIGSYVDAYFSGELGSFIKDHPEIFKKDGTLKAEFLQAEQIALRLDRDELARMLLGGEHQAIKTGQIGGVWYKGKFDSLLSEWQVEAICKHFPAVSRIAPFGGAVIVDLKTVRDFNPIWDEELHEKVSFITHMGYDIQGAIYQKLDGRNAPFVIVAATKEAEPNVDAFYIPDAELSNALGEVEENSPRYAAIKRGEIEPVGCGKCEYCRSTKRLTSIRNYRII